MNDWLKAREALEMACRSITPVRLNLRNFERLEFDESMGEEGTDGRRESGDGKMVSRCMHDVRGVGGTQS